MTKMTPTNRHPSEHEQWPALLANKMGCTLVNQGLWGSSNTRTFRKLREFIDSATVPLDKVFFVIQLSAPPRTEVWHGKPLRDYTWLESPKEYQEEWIRLSPQHIDPQLDHLDLNNSQRSIHAHPDDLTQDKKLELVKYNYARLLYIQDHKHMMETMMTQAYALKGLLMHHNLKHLMVTGTDGFDTFNAWRTTFDDMPEESLRRMTVETKAEGSVEHCKIDGFHPDRVGNRLIAEKLFNIITENTDK